MAILKNSALNLLGSAIPALIAVPALAFLARALSVEQFTLITLAWAVIGYSSIFDGGLSRAVILYVARNKKDPVVLEQIMGTASVFVVISGCCFSVLLGLSTPWLVAVVFNVSKAVLSDAMTGMYWLAPAIPVFLLIQVYQALFEGLLRFKQINTFRTISGAINFLFPVYGVWLEPTFTSAMIGLLISRLGSLALIGYMVVQISQIRVRHYSRQMLNQLLQFGGWITMSNVITPIMNSIDRFILSSFIGAFNAGFYAAPAELIAKLSIVPLSVARAFFPSASARTHHGAELQREKYIALMAVACLTLCCLLPLIIFPKTVLGIWLGDKFVSPSAPVLQILAIGFFFTAISAIPFASIQSKGRADITAKAHLIELVCYLILLLYLVMHWGIIGAAIAWSLRVVVGCMILFWIDQKR